MKSSCRDPQAAGPIGGARDGDLVGPAAAVLYGGGDFLGGLAARRAHVLGVLTLAEGAGAAVALAAAAMSPGPPSLAGLAWGSAPA